MDANSACTWVHLSINFVHTGPEKVIQKWWGISSSFKAKII